MCNVKKTCENCIHCDRYQKQCGEKFVIISHCKLDGRATFSLMRCDKWEIKEDDREN